jgi:hypothetical protein
MSIVLMDTGLVNSNRIAAYAPNLFTSPRHLEFVYTMRRANREGTRIGETALRTLQSYSAQSRGYDYL